MTASALLVEPAFSSIPSYTQTLGPEVADLAAQAGMTPDPEQRLALDAIFGVDERGRASAMEAAVIACRQNLKTGLFKMCALGWLFITDQKLITWSAHEFSTAQEAHRDLEAMIEGTSWLTSRVKTVTHGNGDEGIELMTGQRIKFKARTKTGGRGLTGNKIVLDEAFALQPTHMGALLPTLSAQSMELDPQVLYGSSAGLVGSAVLRAVRDRGRKGGDPSLVYLEWTDDLDGECQIRDCEHTITMPGCRLDDRRRWARANPAMGRRIAEDYIAKERRALPPLEFARERLGWWDDPDAFEIIIPVDVWNALRNNDSTLTDSAVIGVDVIPDRSSAAVATAVRREDGRIHGEVEHRPGVGWVAEYVEQTRARRRITRVMVDPVGPAGSLIQGLGDVTPVGMQDMGRACGAFYDTIVNGVLAHRGQPELLTAIGAARRRPLGDAWAWKRRGSADICPLVALTEAVWGLLTAPQTVSAFVDLSSYL